MKRLHRTRPFSQELQTESAIRINSFCENTGRFFVATVLLR